MMNMKEFGRRLLWPNYSRPNIPPFVWIDYVRPGTISKSGVQAVTWIGNNLTKKKKLPWPILR